VRRLDVRSLAQTNALATALALARGLASDLDDAEVPVGVLARVNAVALALARADALNTDRVRDLDHVVGLGRRLVLALTGAVNTGRVLDREHARGLAVALVGELASVDPVACWAHGVVADDVCSVPGRVPRGLVALAVWLLPAVQRSRYRAEFAADIVELPYRERLAYSARVLTHAWQLRGALQEAMRIGDGVSTRRAKR
jgi:hypothetical protein